MDGREAGGAGAGDDAAGAPADGEELAVARGRAAVGGERDVVALAEHPGERGVEVVEVLAVGDAQQGPAARGVRRRGGVGEQGGQSAAGATVQTARGDPPAARCWRNAAPRSWSAQARRPAVRSRSGAGAGSEGSFSVVAWRGGIANRSTSARVPAYRSASAAVS